MTEGVFEKRYAQRLAWYDNNKNIRTFNSLVLECAHIIREEDADAIKYVNRIQQDLFDKGIIPFMIKSAKDRIRVDEMPNNENKDFLQYVLLAYEYKDDDRWRENRKETKKVKFDIAGIIAFIILIAFVVLLITAIIGAIIHFSWYSIIVIPIFIIMLIGGAGFPLMLMFSKDFRTQCRETWKQAHDVIKEG